MTGTNRSRNRCGLPVDSDCIQWFGREFFGVFAADGECRKISSNFETITGHPVEGCLKNGFLEHIRKVDVRKFRALLQYPQEEKTFRLRLKHNEGHWDWLEVTNATILPDGNIGIIFLKITQEVSKENALQKATLESELAMRGQSEFFAHISHELRTPLNAILGFAQMMHQGMFGEVANPRYRDYIQFLQQSGHELLGKIDDLLEISSLCAGIDKLVENNLPLHDVIKAAVSTHTRDLFAHQVRIDIDIEKLSVVADRVKLQLIFAHLIRNALKFSPPQGMISIRSRREEDGSCIITISDQGRGFTEEQISYFKQSAKSLGFLERNRRLIGFGLPLADELVRLHGGKLLCRNIENSGAEVAISLPARRIIGVIQETGKTAEIPPQNLPHSKHSRDSDSMNF